jgi:hypothetical protein
MPFTFKVGESIKVAWGLYKENFWSLISFGIAMILIQIICQELFKNLFIISFILNFAISFLISFIGIKATLNMLDGKGFKPFSKDSLPKLESYWDFIKTNILMVLCIIPVFFIPLLIIIPGAMKGTFPLYGIPLLIIEFILVVFVSVRLFMAVYLSVEKNQGAVNNIKESWLLTKGNIWMIIWKSFLAGLFGIVGIFALLIGIIVTYPIAMIVIVMLYRYLAGPRIISETTIAPENPIVAEKILENTDVKAEIGN